MGLFIKCELRMPKDGSIKAIYEFRVGYRVVKGTDYRMALTYRNAILWHKITSVVEEELGTLVIYGNTEDVISIQFDLASKDLVVQFIEEKRRKYPPVIAADPAAVVWMCWRDDEDWEDITKLFTTHFESIAPEGTTVKVTPHHGGQGYVTPIDNIGYKAASKAYQESFGKTPIPQRSGGSIPIVALFEQELKSKTILMGFGLDSDAIHSPNEHFGIFNYLKGIETIPLFYKYFTELSK